MAPTKLERVLWMGFVLRGNRGFGDHAAEDWVRGLCKLLPDTDLLVNCTPMGMEGAQPASVPDLSSLKPGALCMDCVYAPAMTPFMAEARRHGHEAGNGIGMLVYQAIYALSFFLNRPFDEETVSCLGKTLMDISGVDPSGN